MGQENNRIEFEAQRSEYEGEWYTIDSGTSTTERGRARVARRVFQAYSDKKDASRGGNIMGTSRFRLLVNGEPIDDISYQADYM